MLPELDTDDWKEAFAYAEGFTRDDVAEVLAMVEGENDKASWLLLTRLSNGQFARLSAWCDYTGWDCEAGGDSATATDKDNLIRFSLTTAERKRLGVPLPEDGLIL